MVYFKYLHFSLIPLTHTKIFHYKCAVYKIITTFKKRDLELCVARCNISSAAAALTSGSLMGPQSPHQMCPSNSWETVPPSLCPTSPVSCFLQHPQDDGLLFQPTQEAVQTKQSHAPARPNGHLTLSPSQSLPLTACGHSLCS